MATAGRPRTPASSSDRRSRATSAGRSLGVDRGQGDRALREQLDQRATGRHQDERPERAGRATVPSATSTPPGTSGCTSTGGPSRSARSSYAAATAALVAEAQADAVDVQLVVDVRARRS